MRVYGGGIVSRGFRLLYFIDHHFFPSSIYCNFLLETATGILNLRKKAVILVGRYLAFSHVLLVHPSMPTMPLSLHV